MLYGDDNENGFKINRSNYKKTNCTCSTLFLLTSKKQIARAAHYFFSLAKNKFARAARFFVFPLPLFCTTTTLFWTTKTSNFLVTHYFLWRNCRMCLPNILFPVFMFAFIFHCRSFSPCWPLAFLIFSPPL